MWQPPAVQLRETSMMMNSRNVRRLQTEKKEQGALLIILSRIVEELEIIINTFYHHILTELPQVLRLSQTILAPIR